MYLSERPRPIDFYKESPELVMDVAAAVDLSHPHGHPPPPPPQQHHHQMLLAESSGEDHEARAPKKRAETWVQDETRCLISFRREVDSLFNTSKSNKHLWEQISNKMREKGFDRSPTMCTDKWRNLLKEFKKVKQQDRGGCGGGGAAAASGKMWYYKEIEELLRDRTKNGSHKSPPHPPPSTSKVDAFIHFSDKGLEDGGGIPFGSVEANGRTSVNLETPLDNDGDPLAITAADGVATNGVPPWNWRESPSGGEGHPSFGGRVITVKWGEYRRRIGIDGTCEAIKEAIKSAFRLRTKRAFWLEDEDNVIRSLDRDMPLGNYTLHLDEGISFKVCLYDDADRMGVHTEDKTLYTDDEFYDFLTRRGLVGLREINGYRCFSNLDDLRAGAMYQGVRRLGD